MEFRPAQDGIQYFYANNLSLGTTPFDVRIVFGEVIDISADKVVVEQRAQVAMSWLEAKVLGEFLRANVEAYEQKNGTLLVPDVGNSLVVPDMVKGMGGKSSS
jgi:Protein of unknown function (DUF3467)